MESRWEIWLGDPSGLRLALLDMAISWEIVSLTNGVGKWKVILPGTFDEKLLYIPDGFVEFWRSAEGGTLKPVMVGPIRHAVYADDESGKEQIGIFGSDGNDLLEGRIIGYHATTAPSSKTDQADDMAKEIVRENLGGYGSIAVDRDLTSTGFTVEPNVSLAPTITRNFAWKNVLNTLREIAETSRENGTRLYFDMVPTFTQTGGITYTFKTFINQRGLDRTAASGKPVYVGKIWNNLVSAQYSVDHTEEVNYVLAGGQGEGVDREIVILQDDSRREKSVWSHREAFADAKNEPLTVGVQAKGEALMKAGRPAKKFSGTIVDTEQVQFGRDWDFGDRIPCKYRIFEFDAEIRNTRISVDSQGQETIQAKVEADL